MSDSKDTGEKAAQSAKPGSSREEADRVGGKLDFGIPARQAVAPAGGHGKGPDQGTGPMRSGDRGVRDTGVGHAPGRPGAGSGGDVDTDFVGLDGSSLAESPPDRTTGPDMTEGGSAAFASGPPAKGENEQPARSPDERRTLDTVDHSGGDATTTGQEP